MEILKIEDLNLKVTKEFFVLSNINLSLLKGEKIVIMGSNGSGRTPLLRCICGLEKGYKGQITLNGYDVKKFDFSSFQLGYLPSFPIFMDTKTVRKNMEYVLKTRKVDKTFLSTKINDVLNELELNRIADKCIYQLSEFDKYLVALARLKLRDLDMLIIDSFEDRFSDEQVEIINKHLLNILTDKLTVIKAVSTLTNFCKNFKIYNIKNDFLSEYKQKNS